MPRPKPPARREKAIRIAGVMADKAFNGRQGHGGNPQLAYRQLTRQEFVVYLAAAFELGCEWESRL